MGTLASELRARLGPAGVVDEPTRLLPYESDALAMLAVRPELVVSRTELLPAEDGAVHYAMEFDIPISLSLQDS